MSHLTALEQFENLSKEMFLQEDKFFPSGATYLGLHHLDAELDSYSPNNLEKYTQAYRKYKADLAVIDYPELPAPQKAEYLMVKSHITAQLNFLTKFRNWENDPCFYPDLAVFSVYMLLIRDYAPLETRVKSAISRLKQFPRLFAEAKANLKNPPKIFTRVAIEIVSSGDGFFNQLIPDLAQSVPGLKEEFLAAGEIAFQAMKEYLRFLNEQLLPDSKGEYAIGAEYFDEIVQQEKLLPYNHQELWDLGHKLFNQTLEQLNQLAQKDYPGKDWQEVLSLIARDHPAKGDLIEAYQQGVKAVKDFVVNKGLVDLPDGERLEVIATPEFVRCTIPYAAYMPPGAYDKGDKAEFWVTPVDESLTPQEQERHLEEHAFPKIHYTVLHESYPGHHLQLSWITTLKSDVLKRIHSTPFIEGWAFYCEEMMKEQGYLGDKGLFCQLKDQLWRAARVILDVGLHTGKISFDEGVKLLTEKVGLAPNCALAEIKRYTSSPTQPLSYFIGKLEILKLKKLFLEKKPGLSLKEFHHLLLNCGSMPPSIIPVYYGLE